MLIRLFRTDSNIVFARLGQEPIVILGSAKVATDLLEKRSHIYSDRKTPIMLTL